MCQLFGKTRYRLRILQSNNPVATMRAQAGVTIRKGGREVSQDGGGSEMVGRGGIQKRKKKRTRHVPGTVTR